MSRHANRHAIRVHRGQIAPRSLPILHSDVGTPVPLLIVWIPMNAVWDNGGRQFLCQAG